MVLWAPLHNPDKQKAPRYDSETPSAHYQLVLSAFHMFGWRYGWMDGWVSAVLRTWGFEVRETT